MEADKIAKQISNHFFAVQLAFGLVAVVLIWYIPAGIHYIDISETKNRSFIAGVENDDWWSIADWKYSTNIHEIDGIIDKHEWFGYPKLIVLNPGIHNIKVYCSWSRFNRTWASSKGTLEINVLPNTIYLLESSYVDLGKIINNGCSINVKKLNDKDHVLLSKHQIDILQNHFYSALENTQQ